MRNIAFIFLVSIIFGQTEVKNLSPVVTYWKTLTQEEKKFFVLLPYYGL